MPLVIGISGASNSGKTSLCQEITKRFPGKCHLLCMDDYYWSLPESSDRYIYDEELNYPNFDDISAVDWDRFCKDVATLASSVPMNDVIFVEGILIFNHPEMARLLEVKVFLQVDKALAYSRRLGRTYDPPEPPKIYFEKQVWPCYEKNLEAIRTSVKGVEFIDTTEMSLDMLAQLVIESTGLSSHT